jgi:hypothetical protein
VTDTQRDLYNIAQAGGAGPILSQECVFAQDAGGPGHAARPVAAILNAEGYNLTQTNATPEPGAMGRLGPGLLALGLVAYRPLLQRDREHGPLLSSVGTSIHMAPESLIQRPRNTHFLGPG